MIDASRPLDLLFVSWERHRRTREIAAALPARLIEVSSRWRRPWRYLPLAFDTVRQVAQLRPAVLMVQCPSVVLAAIAVLARPWLGYRLVLDLHNEAVEPFNYPGGLSRRLLRWLWRRADLCVVTNQPLAQTLGGRTKATVVLPDRVPTFTEGATPQMTTGHTVVFICTYAADEPYREVIEAARLLPPSVQVHITGNPTSAGLPEDLPPNVRIRGFLPSGEYEQLLCQADVLVDLTSMENCLVCGAYEAVGLHKPLVTSDTAALRAYFSRGTVFAQHTAPALAAAIEQALHERERLVDEMRALKPSLDARWAEERQALVNQLAVLASLPGGPR